MKREWFGASAVRSMISALKNFAPIPCKVFLGTLFLGVFGSAVLLGPYYLFLFTMNIIGMRRSPSAADPGGQWFFGVMEALLIAVSIYAIYTVGEKVYNYLVEKLRDILNATK